MIFDALYRKGLGEISAEILRDIDINAILGTHAAAPTTNNLSFADIYAMKEAMEALGLGRRIQLRVGDLIRFRDYIGTLIELKRHKSLSPATQNTICGIPVIKSDLLPGSAFVLIDNDEQVLMFGDFEKGWMFKIALQPPTS